jgi:hypothetical protein
MEREFRETPEEAQRRREEAETQRAARAERLKNAQAAQARAAEERAAEENARIEARVRAAFPGNDEQWKVEGPALVAAERARVTAANLARASADSASRYQ